MSSPGDQRLALANRRLSFAEIAPCALSRLIFGNSKTEPLI